MFGSRVRARTIERSGRRSMKGFYYLHRETKQLIYKHEHYQFEGDLVEKVWPVNFADRRDAWRVVLEGAALGARDEDIMQLSERWSLTFEDCIEMMLRTPTEPLKRAGLHRWVPLVLQMSVPEFLERAKAMMLNFQQLEKANDR